MKPLFLTIFYTLVVVLFDSGVNQAWGASIYDECPLAPELRELLGGDSKMTMSNITIKQKNDVEEFQNCVKEYRASLRDESKQNIEACKESVKEAEKNKQELIDSCTEISSASSSGEEKSACIEIAAACESRTRKEQPTDALGLFGLSFASQSPSLNFNETCLNADLTLAQWEKKTEKAKSELEKKKEKLVKLKEDAQKASEDANKAKQKMEEKAHDMEEEFNKLQKQLEEAGDKEEAEASKQARENASRLRELVSKNLAMTQVKSVKLQERAAMLATMTDALIQTDCLEKVQKFIKEFNGSRRGSIVSGGANSAFSASNTSGSTAQAKWQACLAAAYGQRDATLKKYQNEVQSIDQEMNHLNEEYKSAQKAIQDGEQLRYKSKARRENEKAQSQNLYQQRRQKLITDAMTSIQEAQNKTQQLQSQMTTTQTDISRLSNELAGLDARTPGGDKTHKDAIRSAKKLRAQIGSSGALCGCDVDENTVTASSDNKTKSLHKYCSALNSILKTLQDKFNQKKYNELRQEGTDGD